MLNRLFFLTLFALHPLRAGTLIDATSGNGGFVSASTAFNGSPDQWTAQRGVWIAGGNSSLTSSPFGADTAANSRYVQIHNDLGETLTSNTTFQATAGDTIELSFDYFTSGSGNNTSLTVSLWDSAAYTTYATLGTLSTSSPQASFTKASYTTTASTTNSNLRLRFTLTSAGGTGKDFNLDRVHLAGGTLPGPAISWGTPFLINNDPSNILNGFDPARNGGKPASEHPTIVSAVNYGYGDAAVNGVSFVSSGGSTDYWGAGSSAGTPFGLDSSIDSLLSGHSATAGTSTPFPITFNGLSVGKNYQIQIIVGHDNRTTALQQRQYEVSFGGSDFTSGGSPPTLTRGAQLVSGAFDTVVGSFTAASDSITVQLRSKGGLTANTDPAVCAHVLIGDAPPPLPPVDYATVQTLESGDTNARIVEKAAKTLPRANQVIWQRMEHTYFIHFGVNTFRGVEWGTGYESPSVFNPTALDAAQWVREIKQAGGKQVMLVAKHHDGFCLWPSRYTAQDVASSPWLGGNGDVVRALSDACQAQGLKMGVYVSPADLYQIHADETAGNPEGYYGNGSAVQTSTIPTDPAAFKTSPTTGRAPVSGFGSHTYQVNDYNRYFLNQLYELLTEYGTISQVWFDGANPEPGISETHDYSKWYDLIRKLRPDIVIGIGGDDVRWVGNESGTARETEWSVIPRPMGDHGATDLGSRAKLTIGSTLSWYPAEADVPVLNGWFWSASKTPKSASSLLGIHYTSVGRNANLLLNLSPDTRGLIPDNQLASLRPFGQIVRNTFALNHASGATVTAPASSLSQGSLAADGDLDTFWEGPEGSTTGELVFDLPTSRTFDVISVQEAIATRGQRIEGFAVDTWDGAVWTQRTTGTTVGHKRLLKLANAVTTSRVRLRITAARFVPTIAEFSLHKEAVTIAAPTISNRDVAGMVALSGTAGLAIRYTLDGSTPTSGSPLYTAPFDLRLGGTVTAASFGVDGLPGIFANRAFPNSAPIGWTAPANAADDDPATVWQSATGLPQSLTVDLGAVKPIAGFTYLPPSGGGAGTVRTYQFHTSDDGVTWMLRASGDFQNIANNPVLQQVDFAPCSVRHIRLTGITEITTNNVMKVAELGVIPAGFDAWRRDEGLSASGSTSDADDDGRPLWLEYAQVSDPFLPDSANPVVEWQVGTQQPGVLFRRDPGRFDVLYTLEAAADLSALSWQTVDAGEVVVAVDAGGIETVRLTENSPPAGASRRFYRIRYRAL